LYGTHHGLTNAVVLPYVLRHNADVLGEKARTVAQLLGLAKPGFDSFLKAVLKLRKTTGIPNTLADIGVGEDRAAEIGALAFDDPTRPGNPKPVSADSLRAIFIAAVRGTI